MPVERGRILSRFQQLVSIDAPSYGERAMADELTRQLTALGYEVQEDNAGDALGGSAGNLIIKIPGNIDLPPLLFSGHMDTVEPAGGKRAQIHPDGTVTSDGSTVLGADDISALTAILEALTVLREDQLPHRPLEIVFAVAEEPYTKGSHQLDFSQLCSKESYVLDMDGAIGAAALQAPSILYFRAAFTGKAAHAGMSPELGVHAIQAAAKAVECIPMGHVDALTTVNIGTIQGGLATNIVPEVCQFEGEIRGFDHASALQSLSQVEEICQNAAKELGAQVDFQYEIRTVAYQHSPDSAVAKRFSRICQQLEVPVEFTRTFGGSDNNTFAEHGIQGLVLASAMHRCHSCQEYTTVDELEQLCRMTLALMTDAQE